MPIFCLLFLASCNFLDDPQPTDALTIDEAFNTADDLENALTGAYDAVQNGHFLGRNLVVLPELMSGNVSYSGGGWFGLPEISTLQVSATNWYVENVWRQAYLAINQLNQVLASLPEVKRQDPVLTQAAYNQIEGEAAFLRGVIYFELVRLFGLPYDEPFLDSLGVPLMLAPVLKKENLRFPSRATVGEVYSQVIADLDLAINRLVDGNTSGRADRFAALACRAQVAFQQRDYEKVAALTFELVEASPFQLTEMPGIFFLEKGNSEVIWSILNEPGDEIAGGDVFSMLEDAVIQPGIRASFDSIVSPSQLEQIGLAGYDVVDLRVYEGILTDYPFVTADTLRVLKFSENSGTPVARLTEFLLMRAEALARLGNAEEALILLNRVRLRSLRIVDSNGYEVPEAGQNFVLFEMPDFGNTDELVNAIIRERKVELAFEGKYFHDLMRLRSNVENSGKVYAFKAPELRLPIPQREIDANPNLKQNP